MKNANAVALGSIKSEKKSLSSRENGIEWKKPHFKKCKYFESIYPYTLENNEWKEKFAIGKTKTNRTAMYNPDYFCPTTEFFIEVTTSKPNMVEQGWKWREAIKRGLRLKVFWWEGEDITYQFSSKKNAKKLRDSQGKNLSESAYIRLLIEGGHTKI